MNKGNMKFRADAAPCGNLHRIGMGIITNSGMIFTVGG